MKDTACFTAGYAGIATATVLGLMVLTGCSSEPQKTSGLLDEVKYSKAVKAVPAKTHKDTRVVDKTQKVCETKDKKGRCTKYKDVKIGTKTVTVTVTDSPGKPGKSAIWCVELDDVKGDKDADDQLFEVSWETYSKWENEIEGTKVTDMEYSRSVAKCKR